jgi:K+-transporting ATPase ATPase C chain
MSELRPALMVFVLLTLLTGAVYPLVVTGIGQGVFGGKASGSPILLGERVVGSRLLGQPFSSPKYFWSRPSATPTQPYKGAVSSGSNQGPLSPALAEAVQERIAVLRQADPGNSAPVPVDLVTASGSGLDPHISVAAAEYQISRVARVRNLPASEVEALVREHTEGRTFGALGEPRVNVLGLNLALDDRAKR